MSFNTCMHAGSLYAGVILCASLDSENFICIWYGMQIIPCMLGVHIACASNYICLYVLSLLCNIIYACACAWEQPQYGWKVCTLLKQSVFKVCISHHKFQKISQLSMGMYKLLDIHACMPVISYCSWIHYWSMRKYNFICPEIFHTLSKYVIHTNWGMPAWHTIGMTH